MMRARRKGRDGLAAGPPSHVEQSFRGVASLSLRCRSKFHWHCCAQLDCAVHVAGSTVRAARRSRQYTVQCITQYTMYHIIVHAPMLPGWVPAATSVSDLARGGACRGVSRPHARPASCQLCAVCVARVARVAGARSGAECTHAVTKVMRADSVPTHDSHSVRIPTCCCAGPPHGRAGRMAGLAWVPAPQRR